MSAKVQRVFAGAVFVGAVWLLWLRLRTMSWTDFLAALATTRPTDIAFAVGLTAASYACLSGTEWVSLRALGRRLTFLQAAMVAAPAYALTNSAGFSPATGTLLRIQLYRRRGIGLRGAAAVALVAGVAVTLSGLVAAGLLLAIDPSAAAAHAPGWIARVLGLVLMTPALLWFRAFAPGSPRWLGGGGPALRDPKVRALGLATGVGDWLCSGAALFVLLPGAEPSQFPGFFAAYVAGSLLSAATGVPGGLGVFEAIVLVLSAVVAQVHETAAALLLYRGIYSLGPLGLWGGAVLIGRFRRWGRREAPP